MKFRETFRFELAYQLRRVTTWLYPAVLAFFAYVLTTEDFVAGARNGEYLLGAPFVIATVTINVCLVWLLVAAYVAGDAAARDVETRMHPLCYTAPVSKADYLGGRFAAAFALNALILLAVPSGILLAVSVADVDAAIRGPFRAAAYLTAYAFIALPNVFFSTAIQFSFAALTRRAIASYLGGLLLGVTAFLAALLQPDVGQLLDPIGVIARNSLTSGWTPAELNTRLVALEGPLLWNRLVWLGIALGTLALTHFRFRFRHHTGRSPRRFHRDTPETPKSREAHPPHVRRTFGFATGVRQTLAIASASFGMIVKSWGGILLLALVALLALASAGENLDLLDVPLLPRTDYILHNLTIPEVPPAWVIVPLLIVFCAGELMWREREAGQSEIVGAAPVPDWVLFLGRFVALTLVLVVCMAIRMAVGIFTQLGMGYRDIEIGLYLRMLFGIQLADYVLLALLAIVVHAVVNQKHLAHLVTVVVYVLITVAAVNGFGHKLLVYASGPGLYYTDLRGFGSGFLPWLWFKLYWAAWALLLAVVARLLWVRGRERMARRNLTRTTAWIGAAALAGIVTLGSFIFYNTNVLNEYVIDSVEYEHRYGKYAGIPQPVLTAVRLHVELYPHERKAEIRGRYHLVNRTSAAIDSIHVATVPDVETRAVTFDRPAALVSADDPLGYRIYRLETPLQPGHALRLDFEVHSRRGFRHEGKLPAEAAVVANGTSFSNEDWLPAIGYQRARGLAPSPPLQSPYDFEPRNSKAEESISFEAVVGTSEDQIAVAPGALRETWTDRGRRYFRYSTDAPIGNEYAFFSARYAVHEGQWKNVAIRILHHRAPAANVERMLRSARASLEHYTAQFGPYPYRHLTLVERAGHGLGMHADAALITFSEGFTLLHPEGNPRGPDLPFSVVAHEVAHQWWGSYLAHKRVEGAVLLSETLAQYSAYQVVKKTYGHDHLRRLLLAERREEEQTPRPRAGVPLLRANDRYARYRRGPWAMYTLSEYISEERVNAALRSFLGKRRSGARPLATSLDLYRELQAVTPQTHQSLLHDLFEANTFWELKTERASAEQTASGSWRVKLEVRARKVVVDPAGTETELPMQDWVQIGVFEGGTALHLQMHRLRSGLQTITITVPRKPTRARVDPNCLLNAGCNWGQTPITPLMENGGR